MGDDLRGINVLVVDDDQSIRSLLRIAFSIESGVGEIREAPDGNAAVDLCDRFTPDLIFLDYWMPAMDGGTTADLIRSRHPRARIVAFSGVLEQTPEWADELCVKGDMPNLERVIDLTIAERGL